MFLNMRRIGDVLLTVLEHGIEFCIGYFKSDIEALKPEDNDLTYLKRNLGKNIYLRGHTEAPLVRGADGTEFIQRWLARVLSILSYPHAGSFLFAGGPLWWLALFYGGQDLFGVALQGPSIQTTYHEVGANDSHEDDC